MSKIGILTYHRAYNYGALLQAFALRSFLQTAGHDVSFIDYWPEYHKKMYALFSFSKLRHRTFKSKLFYIWDSIIHYTARKKFYAKIQKNVDDLITPHTSLDEKYDIIIYGSDQIWRKQPFINTYNPVYFGQNSFTAKKHIAYAASMGKLPNNDIDRLSIKKLIKNLDDISVREKDLQDLLKELGIDAKLVLDPTLLLPTENWNVLTPQQPAPQKGYIMFFEIVRKSFNLEEVKHFAKIHNSPIRILYNDVRKIDSEIPTEAVDLIEFLECTRNAEFVFTSSFHALVFSILFHKQFFACFKSNEGRAKTLLKSLGLESRLLKYGDSIPLSPPPIDYTDVERKLKLLREQSINFLTQTVCLNEN